MVREIILLYPWIKLRQYLFVHFTDGVLFSLAKEVGIDVGQLGQLDRRELELFVLSQVSKFIINVYLVLVVVTNCVVPAGK